MDASTSPLRAESAGPADLPTARAERDGQVVDIRPLLLERLNQEIIEAALDGMRAAEKRAASTGRPRLRLVAGGER